MARRRNNPARRPMQTLIPLWRKREGGFRVYLHVIPRGELWQGVSGDLSFDDVQRLSRFRVGLLDVDVAGENCSNPNTGEVAAEIIASAADKGWGPLLYDFAALVATSAYNLPLVADRYTLSDEAKKVWKFYGDQRWDVDHVDLSSSSWDCDPMSGGPEWGIRVPSYVFSEQWGVSASDWLDNAAYRQLADGPDAAKANPKGRRRKKTRARKNPVGGFTTEDIQAFSSYTGKGEPSGADITRERIKAAMRVVERDIKRSPLFRPPSARTGEPREWDLFAYQKAGVAYFLEQVARGQNRAAIFDPMGLGKTNQGVGSVVALGRKALPVLVVAPRSAHQAWRDAFGWLSTITVAPGRGVETPEADVYLADYRDIRDLRGMSPSDLQAIGVRPNMVIFDEAHEIRNPSQQTQGAEALADAAHYTLMLTGTPALRSAFDAFSLMRLMEGQPLRSKAELTAEIRGWETKHGGERAAQATGTDYLDVIDPDDAQLIEPRMRGLAARRSRRAVRATKAAPDAMLQDIKTRRPHMVTVPRTGPYRTASDEALASLLGGDRIRFPGEEAAGGIRSFETLQNAITQYEGMLSNLTGKVRFDGSITKDVFTKSVRSSHAYKNMLKQARTAYLPIPRPGEGAREQRYLRSLMPFVVIPAAVKLQKDIPGDIVYASHAIAPLVELGERLSAADRNREVYIYTGDYKGMFQNGRFVPDRARRGEDEADVAARLIATLEGAFAEPTGQDRTVLLSSAALTGLSLPAADTLVFIDRFYSPGLEDQMEDRINRAGKSRRKGAKTDIVYLIPDDIWGYVLAHRSANRRASIFSAFGEKFGRKPGDIGDDYATPLLLVAVEERLEELERASQRRRLEPEEAVTRNVLLNYQFIEHPHRMARQMEEAAWQRGLRERKEQQEGQIKQARERARPRVLTAKEVAAKRKKKVETPLSRFLRQIDADEIVLWTLPGRSAVQAWDKNWLIMPKGQIVPAKAWGLAEADEIEYLHQLTMEQQNVLASAAYKAKPNRGRRRGRRGKRKARRERRWR